MTRPREKSVKARAITSPVLHLSVEEEIDRLQSEPEWTSGREDAITLVKYPRMRVVLVALKRGSRMRQRKVEGPLSIYVISGRIAIAAEEDEYTLKAKGLFTMRQKYLDEVRAIGDSVFLLTLFKFES